MIDCRSYHTSSNTSAIALGVLIGFAAMVSMGTTAASASPPEPVARQQVIADELRRTPRGTPEFDALRDEYIRLTRQIAEAEQARREERDRQTATQLTSIRERSFVIHGHASAYALLEEMYPRYLESLPREMVGIYPPQLFYDITDADETVAQLLNRQIELGIINRPLSEQERQALNAVRPAGSRDAVQIMFARSVTVVLVHPRNPVRQMTIEQVEQAYRQDGGNWRMFGGSDRPIERVGTTYPLLSWNMFTWHVLKGQRVEFPDQVEIDRNRLPKVDEIITRSRERAGRFPGGGPFPRYNQDRRVVEEVAKQINAIGYCLLPADGRLPEGVRALPLAAREGQRAFPPTSEHILLEEYPLQDTLWLVVRPDASEQARAFAEFAASERAAPLIAELGLHPVTERDRLLVARRVEAQRRGEGPKVTMRGTPALHRLARDLAMERTKAVGPIQLDFAGQDGLLEFLEGRTELLLVAGEFNELVRNLHAARLEAMNPERITLGGQAVALIVHPENTTASMTPDTIRSIFHGDTTTWPEQAGVTGGINRYGLLANAPATALFYETAIDARRRTRIDYKREDSEVISAVLFDKSGIGWVDVAALRPEQIVSESNPTGVRVVSIEVDDRSVAPTPAAIRDGQYPLSRPLYLYVHPDAGEAAKSLAEFLRTADLREVFRSHGFVQAP
jgi:ABC-type phosphate transport system substrate-binding protein